VNARHADSTPSGTSYHRGDPDMGDLPHRVQPDPDGRYTVDVHVTPDGRARIGDHTYSPEEFADILRRNGDYDGRPIRLIGCDAGSNDFATRLSRELDTPVLAPNKPAWTDSNGRVFSSDYEIGPDGKPRPKIPPNGEWDIHHPDGTHTKASDDGFTPNTNDTDKHDLDPDDAVDRGDQTTDSSGIDQEFDELNERVTDNRTQQERTDPRGESRTISSSNAHLSIRNREFDVQHDASSGGGNLKNTHMANPANGSQLRNPQEQLFPTQDLDNSGNPVPPGEGINRRIDSEPKQLEDLTREILRELTRKDPPIDPATGQTRIDLNTGKPMEPTYRKDLDKQIRDAIMAETRAKDPSYTGNMPKLDAEDVPKVLDRVLSETLPKDLRGDPAAAREAVTGDLRFVIDFPGDRPIPDDPTSEVCLSCQDVFDAFGKAFPGIRIEARNPAGEVVYGD
jgi:hypothetical protein